MDGEKRKRKYRHAGRDRERLKKDLEKKKKKVTHQICVGHRRGIKLGRSPERAQCHLALARFVIINSSSRVV